MRESLPERVVINCSEVRKQVLKVEVYALFLGMRSEQGFESNSEEDTSK